MEAGVGFAFRHVDIMAQPDSRTVVTVGAAALIAKPALATVNIRKRVRL
jgi:hypothetical protein